MAKITVEIEVEIEVEVRIRVEPRGQHVAVLRDDQLVAAYPDRGSAEECARLLQDHHVLQQPEAVENNRHVAT